MKGRVLDITVWAELLGVFALSSGVLSHQIKKPRVALWALCVPCIFWILHFYSMAAIPGLIISIAALVRNICAAGLSDKFMKPMVAVCLLVSFSTILSTFSDSKDLLPLAAALTISLAVYLRDKPLSFRLYNLLGELSWLSYGLFISSISLSAGSAIMSLSIITSILRHDLKIMPILQPGWKNVIDIT